jgi:DNA-binding transcriptional regulator YdaS (Cro superfamily)
MAERSISLTRAISLKGSAKALAAAIGVSPQALSQWRRVPVERVLDVERVTGVPRHELRPDIYPVEPAPAEGAAPFPQEAAE